MSLKVTKWVEVETEVSFHVDASDIAAALVGETDTPRAAMHCLGNVASFMKALPDDVIAQMTDENRRRVREFLQEQAQRFAPPPSRGEEEKGYPSFSDGGMPLG